MVFPDAPQLSYRQMVEAVPVLRLRPESIQAMSAGELAKARELLERYAEARKWNPLLGYVPASRKHFAFHTAGVGPERADTRVILGGNRSGKTTGAIVDDLVQMCPPELLPDHLRQFKQHECPFYARVMAPDMKRTMIPVIHQKLRDWTPRAMLKRGSFDHAYDKTNEVLRLECGCRFDFLSYEMTLDKFGGAALHRCHYDEEPPEDIRNECLWRLADFDGDELFSFTPLKGLSWPYRKLWKRRNKDVSDEDPRQIRAWTISIHENRTMTPRAVAKVLSEIDNPAERRQREHGEFSERGGMVYPNLRDAEVPDIEPGDPLLDGLEWVLSIDPGLRWAGLVLTGFDRDNYALTIDCAKLYGDRFPDGINTRHIAEAAFRMLARWGLAELPDGWQRLRPDPRDPASGRMVADPARPKPRIARGVRFPCDPSMRIRNQLDSETVMAELQRLGVPVTPAQNDVDGRIAHTRRRLSDGSLRVCARCEELFDEGIEYAQEERADGVLQIIKRNDHVLDAWGYGLMERPWEPWRRASRLRMGDDVAVPPPPARNRRAASIAGKGV